ncbi:MAG: hypothetical protein AAFR45_04490 [Pseudomonadota bacterium]
MTGAAEHRVSKVVQVAGLIFVLAAACAQMAAAQNWFHHPFGELRAYHKDWLVVCQNDGAGDCRAVQIVLDAGDTRVGPSRLALERDGDGTYRVVVYDKGMPSSGIDPVRFEFDGAITVLDSGDWIYGEPSIPNVQETFSIPDREVAHGLIEDMKAGRFLTVRYTDGNATFSLRGVTAALTAIEQHIKERDT